MNWNKLKKDELIDRIEMVENWINAYPQRAFKELSKAEWDTANEILKNGPSLSRISADNMRHVLKGIKRILEAGR